MFNGWFKHNHDKHSHHRQNHRHTRHCCCRGHQIYFWKIIVNVTIFRHITIVLYFPWMLKNGQSSYPSNAVFKQLTKLLTLLMVELRAFLSHASKIYYYCSFHWQKERSHQTVACYRLLVNQMILYLRLI